MFIMQVSNNTSDINFCAIPCKKTHIKVYNEALNKFKRCPATLVKLEADNEHDRMAISFAEHAWKNAKYMKKIATASHFMNFNDIEIYALTTQRNDFDNLVFNKIIGFAEMRPNQRNKNCLLNRLQIRPDIINVNQKNKKIYKHAGKAILNSLKKIYKNITLRSEASRNIEKFYKNNGFVEDYFDDGTYYWSSNPFKRLMFRIRYEMAKRFLLVRIDR